MEIAIGLAPRYLHLLNLRIDFAERFVYGRDHISHGLLPGLEVSFGLALKFFQTRFCQLQK